MFFEILLASLMIMAVSLVGSIAIWKRAGNILERNINYLVSFSAGVFVVVAFHLGAEAFHLADDIKVPLFWIMSGAILVWIIVKLMPLAHHHHSQQDAHNHSQLDARRILISDAIHNVGDGLVLAAAFVLSSTLGWLTALSILVHELVQEISEFFVLRQSGYTTKQSLKYNFLVSGTILIGAILGYQLLGEYHDLEVAILGFATGSFLIVILHDLIPHSIHNSLKTKCVSKHIFWFCFGLIVMLSLGQLFEHELHIEHLASIV